MKGAWWRWLLVPWRSVGVALALVGAAAAPAFLMASAGTWRAGAADEITRLLVEAGPSSDEQLTIETNALFLPDGTDAADAAVVTRLAQIEDIGRPVRTLSTPRGLAAGGRDEDPFTVPVRLANHTGAIATIDPVRQLSEGVEGAWISRWLSDEFNVDIGDTLVYFSGAEPEIAGADVVPGGGPQTELLVVGVYETLWTVDGGPVASKRGVDLSQFLSSMPPALIPKYVNPFGAPSFSLVFVDDDIMKNLGVTGTARWSATVRLMPDTHAGLVSLVSSYRSLERGLALDPELTDALERQARFDAPTPLVVSSLAQTLRDTDRAVAGLDQPLNATRAAGVLLGLIIVVAAAVFSANRRPQELRLLASEGDRWEQFAGRAAAQFVLPTAVGTTAGVAAALAAARVVGPSAGSIHIEGAVAAVDWAGVVIVFLITVALGATVSGILGSMALSQPRLGGRSPVAVILVMLGGVATVGFLWTDAGSDPGRLGDIDLALVSLPLVVFIVSVAITLVVVGLVARRMPVPARISPVLFLAWRRATGGGEGGMLVGGAIAVSLGIVAFSTMLVGSLERTTADSLFTEIGGETLVDLIGHPPAGLDLPAHTTIVSFDDTRLTPGEQQVRVVAIDTETAGAAFAWPPNSAQSFDDLVEMLNTDAGGEVPAVAINGQTLPTGGRFGISNPIPYEIVGSVASVPLASSSRATILVAADRVDSYTLERLARNLQVPPDDPLVLAEFVAPSSRYRQHLVSLLPKAEIDEFVAENGLRSRSTLSASERKADADLVAPTFAFGYMRWMGVVGAVSAAASLVLYLSARRAARELESVMTQRMGMSRNRQALVTVVEVVALLALAVGTAALVSPMLVRRVLPGFDPAPGLPPDLRFDAPVAELVAAFAILLAAIAMLVWIAERLAARKPDAKVLRDSE